MSESNYSGQVCSETIRHQPCNVQHWTSTNDTKRVEPTIPMANININSGYYLHNKSIGEGLFGKVRLATHLKTFQLVAVSVINKKKLKTKYDCWMVDTEISSLKLLRHQNIARLLQLIETDHHIYVIREYCSNGDLYEYIRRNGTTAGRLPECDARNILTDLMKCLEYIHERGFAHRDIRPENVLFDFQNRVKLIGFRFAQIHSDGCSTGGAEVGSIKTQYMNPEYVPPELLMGKKAYSPVIDVWSCGVLLHYMLTGTLPFQDNCLARLIKKIEAGTFTVPNELPGDVCQLLLAMLEKNPLERITVKQILRHRWIDWQINTAATIQLMERIDSSVTIDDFDDRLNPTALHECFQLHSNEVDDIIVLRFNIRYKFCYQTATYWLIKENFANFKKQSQCLPANSLNGANDYSVGNRRRSANTRVELFRAMHPTASAASPATVANGKLIINNNKSCAHKHLPSIAAATTTSLTDLNLAKQQNLRLRRSKSIYDNFLIRNNFHQWRNNNLKSNTEIFDEEEEEENQENEKSYNRTWKRAMINSSSIDLSSQSISSGAETEKPKPKKVSLKKSLSRKLSLIVKRKQCINRLSSPFERNLSKSESNSPLKATATTVGKSYSVEEGIATHLPQSNVSNSSSIYAEAADDGDESRHSTTTSWLSALSFVNSTDSRSDSETSCPVAKPLTPGKQEAKQCTSIITRFVDCGQCMEVTQKLLTNKGINCKREKERIRCCISTMNTVIMAFQLEFVSFPSLNLGSFVIIKIRKLRGNFEDFCALCTDLTKYFEKRQ